jgi:cold-inducible RNA-binding protein
MGTNIYVGNLSYSVRDADLSELFSQFGDVKSAKVIMERDTDRSKGFGFVEMKTEDGAQQAIAALNEQDFKGRALRVNEARPRPERKPFNRNNRY